MNIAFIPARGGSKRLPRKNILPFLGKPMLAHTIEVAKSSGCFDVVLVSTEDEEIASIALQYGAEVDYRDSHLASDTSTVADVCSEFLHRQHHAGVNYHTMMVLYAASPLRIKEDVQEMMSLLYTSGADMVMATTEYSQYVHQALLHQDQGFTKPVFPDLIKKRYDVVPKMVVSNGSLYAFFCDYFMETPDFYPAKLKTYVMPKERSIDIDDAFDLVLAKTIAEQSCLFKGKIS